jgi:DNA-binding LacI/PurR family transcriptional regulator
MSTPEFAKQPKPTLKNIAKELGVSKASVSNVFNKPDIVSPELKEKVLKYCEQVGYAGPSVTARSLITGKTDVVGVFLCDTLAFGFTDPVASQFLAGVGQTLDLHHASMLLLPTSEAHYQNSPIETMPDSFILYGEPLDKRITERLIRQSKPMVTVDFELPMSSCRQVAIDDQEAAFKIASYAIERHIATQASCPEVLILGLRLNEGSVPGPVNMQQLFEPEFSVSRKRLDGYQEALSDKQVSVREDNVWHLPWLESEAIRTMVRGLLTDTTRTVPDIILCMSDKVAIATLQVARELNIDVPNRTQIVGFDDIESAADYGLTTIAQPIFEKGEAAAMMALGLEAQENVTLSTQFVARQSTR